MSAPDLQAVEAYIHQAMPLTRAMGIRISGYENGVLVLTAPLDLNHNHLGTGFGGSLAVLATVAGYSLVWLELGDPGSHVVIRQSAMSFDRPVTGELRATCNRPDERKLATFKAAFAAKGKARIVLGVTIGDSEAPAATFTGTFVALR